MAIRTKDLSKIGYTDNVARSKAVNIISKHCKHDSKETVLALLSDLLEDPGKYKDNDVWKQLNTSLLRLKRSSSPPIFWRTSRKDIKLMAGNSSTPWPNNRWSWQCVCR